MKISSRRSARCGPTTDSAAPYCGAISRWLTPWSRARLQPPARLLHPGIPAGGTTEDGHAALVTRATQASTLHVGAPSTLSFRMLNMAPTVGHHGHASGLDVHRTHEDRATELLHLGRDGIGVVHSEIDAPDWAARRPACRAASASFRRPTLPPASIPCRRRAGRLAAPHVLGVPAEHGVIEGLGGLMSVVTSSFQQNVLGSLTTCAPMCVLGCQRPITAPNGSAKMAMRPTSMTSMGRHEDGPPVGARP